MLNYCASSPQLDQLLVVHLVYLDSAADES